MDIIDRFWMQDYLEATRTETNGWFVRGVHTRFSPRLVNSKVKSENEKVNGIFILFFAHVGPFSLIFSPWSLFRAYFMWF